MKAPVLALGGGGHAKVVLDGLKKLAFDITGILDPDPGKTGARIFGIPVLGNDDQLETWPPGSVFLVNAVGGMQQTDVRQKLFKSAKEKGYLFVSVVHPDAMVADTVEMGEGVQVMAGAVIQPGCRIGTNAVINTRVALDHDCLIGEHAFIGPGAVVCGGAEIGEGALLGPGAIVMPEVRVGPGAVVKAGTVVADDVQ